jgi:hypothetical protein
MDKLVAKDPIHREKKQGSRAAPRHKQEKRNPACRRNKNAKAFCYLAKEWSKKFCRKYLYSSHFSLKASGY